MATIDTHADQVESQSAKPTIDVQHHEQVDDSVVQLQLDEETQVKLSWTTYIVVLCCFFAQITQLFIITGATSVIAFIVRDIGDAPDSSWIIQGPLLMQSVLSPIVGRLSDVLDRKWMVTVPPVIAAVGAIICALSHNMPMLIGGGILIGTTVAVVTIVHTIPSEILPLKYRPVANGISFFGGALGGVAGKLSAGALTNTSPHGWRYIFWIQVALHMLVAIGFLTCYWPPRRHPEYPRMTLAQMFWAIDPIGSGLQVVGITLMLLSLDWGGSRFPWSSSEVAAPLSIGCVFFVLFCVYEWKGRKDGLIAHVFFKSGPNFGLAIFAFIVEGWIYYSAVNAIVPQLVLNIGFEDNSWSIAKRQMSYQIPVLLTSIPITWYATRFKDLRSPLLVAFTFFLAISITYTTIRPSWSLAQYALNVITGMGQAGPLTLVIALVQFSAPHAYLSTATGLAYTSRAVGGAFGTAVLNSIVNGYLTRNYAKQVGGAAVAAGLPASSVHELVIGIQSNNRTLISSIEGLTDHILAEAVDASHWTYAHAYRLAWASIIPFVVLSIVAVLFLRDVKQLMTNRIEATVEKVHQQDAKTVVEDVN
ncbi:major facilitator superfamily domain-containing protein [Xylogone sp. PMI_703]|nr:major facilitator superfamily domain-containing protein [Xylogone sp. PMI_703]